MVLGLLAAVGFTAFERITISPGYYSLPQLAERLSSPDHRVTCAKALDNRLLFVSIHDQPVSRVKSLVGETLGVSFTLSGTGEERIEPETVRQSEERRLLHSLQEHFGSRVNDVVSACAALLPTVTQASIDANTERLQAKQPTPAYEQAAGLLQKLADGDFSPIAYYALAKGVDIDSLMDKDALEVGNANDLEAAAGPSWHNQLSLRTFVTRGLGDLPISDDQREAIVHTFLAESFSALRLSFDPYTGSLSFYISVSFRPDANSGARGDVNLIPDLISISYPKLTELADSPRSSDYLKRRQVSDSLLSSSFATDAVHSPAGSRAVSEFVSCWATATKKDVIMEVSQGRDLSPSRFSTGRAFDGDLRHELQGVPGDYESEMTHNDAGLQFREGEEPLAKTILSEPTYTCRDAAEVLCIRDEFGFLDHLYRFPSSAIAEFETRRFQSETRFGVLIPTLGAIKAYCLGVSPEEAGIVSRFNCALVSPDVEAAYPILHGVFASKSLAQSLTGRLTSGSPLSVPVSSLKDFQATKFCDDLRSEVDISYWIAGLGAAATANCLYPSLADTLEGSTIQVHFEKGEKETRLSFSLTHPHYLPIPRLTPDGTLSHEPADDETVPVISWPAVQICGGD